MCGYDNEDDIPDEILDLAIYIRDKFNACEIGYLPNSRDFFTLIKFTFYSKSL